MNHRNLIEESHMSEKCPGDTHKTARTVSILFGVVMLLVGIGSRSTQAGDTIVSPKTFQGCVVSKGGFPLTPTQQKTFASCRKANMGNRSGFESCLSKANIPLPTPPTIAAEKACRAQLYPKSAH